jgi:hypothetical protein
MLAALAAPADGEVARVIVGPFTILSTVKEVKGFPYSVTVKTTSLRWSSADQLVTYDLQDSGKDVSVQMTFASKSYGSSCSATLMSLPLDSKPVTFFDTKGTTRWACITSPPDHQAVAATPELAAAPYAREIETAGHSFPKAYAAFLKQTHKLHGSSDVRCLKFGQGYHGGVCVQRSDE